MAFKDEHVNTFAALDGDGEPDLLILLVVEVFELVVSELHVRPVEPAGVVDDFPQLWHLVLERLLQVVEVLEPVARHHHLGLLGEEHVGHDLDADRQSPVLL